MENCAWVAHCSEGQQLYPYLDRLRKLVGMRFHRYRRALVHQTPGQGIVLPHRFLYPVNIVQWDFSNIVGLLRRSRRLLRRFQEA